MSVLDRSLADTVVRVWPAVIADAYVATIGRFNESPFYADLVGLDALGLVRLGHGFTLVSSGDGDGVVWSGSKALIFKGMAPHHKNLVSAGVLTQSGKELASILPFGGDEQILRELGPLLMEQFGAKAVFLSDYDRSRMTPQGSLELLTEKPSSPSSTERQADRRS
jgi:hypothetical protein